MLLRDFAVDEAAKIEAAKVKERISITSQAVSLGDRVWMYGIVRLLSASKCQQCGKKLYKHSDQYVCGGWFYCSLECIATELRKNEEKRHGGLIPPPDTIDKPAGAWRSRKPAL